MFTKPHQPPLVQIQTSRVCGKNLPELLFRCQTSPGKVGAQTNGPCGVNSCLKAWSLEASNSFPPAKLGCQQKRVFRGLNKRIKSKAASKKCPTCQVVKTDSKLGIVGRLMGSLLVHHRYGGLPFPCVGGYVVKPSDQLGDPLS